MKLVDKMKDEKLGTALLYNFTKGYGHVPMDVYDIVLPLLFDDSFRKHIQEASSFEECLQMCQSENAQFFQNILTDYQESKEMTSRALGICLLNQYLRFEVEDAQMKGIANESSILDLNEAIRLGEELKGKYIDEILKSLKKKKMKIVFLDRETVGHDLDFQELMDLGEVYIYDQTKREDIVSRIHDAHIVITNKHILNEEVLKQAPLVELICVTATGYNNIDIDYCHQHQITVCNVQGYSTNSVAQHTFALLLDLYEKNHYYHNYVSSGQYSSSSLFTHFEQPFYELEGKTWGIVGLGNIGKKVAQIAKTFGCHVVYYSTSGKNNSSEYQKVDFDTLLSTCDIITIHAPLNKQTHHLFNKEAFAKMKKTSYLINVGRGPIINENDLYEALKNDVIAGAGLDVFEQEPMGKDNPLLAIQNPTKLLMTPHIAWATQEARARCIKEVIENIKAYQINKPRNVC